MSEISPLPTTERLLTLVDSMVGKPVVMLVDLVADRFVTGEPKRISREAPVLILRFVSESFRLGGGANAVANVAALGGNPLPLGFIGNDSSGTRVLEALEDLGVPTEGIVRRDDYRTPAKTRILGGGRHAVKQQVVRLDVEQFRPVSANEQRQLLERLESWADRARVAVLSDYGYGSVAPELLSELRGTLLDDGVVLCDSRYRLSDFTGLDGATPNEEEAEALLGRRLGDEEESLSAAGTELLERLNAHFVLVTRGSSGMALFTPGARLTIPVHGTDQVADVTGAGDTVIGTFALALAAGGSPVEAALLANYAGGSVVMKMGTATLTPDELRQAIESDPHPLEEARWVRS